MAACDSVGTVSLKLSGIHGDDGKTNDIYVFGQVKDCKQHVIYFGGDVQDYQENMEHHRDNKKFVEWSTENTASLIHQKFSNSLVFVIKPSKMHLLTFAVYSNFVLSNDFGSPTHDIDFGATKHLRLLYSSILKEICNHCKLATIGESLPVHLIGFSKGCVVLNQLVMEMPAANYQPLSKEFLSKIKSVYWLDGGHSGGAENTWVTDETPLQYLAALDSHIFIHVTPYQVKDPMRPWIGKQHTSFYRKLKSFNAKVQAKDHFENENPSIENHFKLLRVF